MHNLPSSWFANSAGCRQIPACNLNPEQFRGGKMSFCQSCGAALAGAQGETWVLFFRTIRKFDGRRVESKIPPSLPPEGKQPRVANPLVEDHLRPAATKAGILSSHRDVREKSVDDDPRRFGFHNLRHSLASFLIRTRTDPKTDQTLLRHSDVKLTLQFYAHAVSRDRMAAAGRMLAAILSHAANESRTESGLRRDCTGQSSST